MLRRRLSAAQYAALSALLALVLSACSEEAPERTAAVSSDLATLTVTVAQDADGRAWDGTVEAVREARLSAQTSGRVVAVNRDVNDAVAQDEVLVRLSEVEQRAGVSSARAQLRATEAALAEAQVTRRRYQELAEKQFVAASQLDQLQSGYEAALAARDAARARVADAAQQSSYTEIRAPFTGRVGTRAVEPGESVAAGQWLMTVIALDDLRVAVSVPQSAATLIRDRPAAQITLDDGRRVEAATVTVFPGADPGTHSVTVRVDLPPLTPAPLPGSTAKVEFSAAPGARFPRIPTSALVRRGEVSAVYVLNDRSPMLRQLRLGRIDGEWAEVIAGLKPGENIAADPVAAAQALESERRNGH